MKTKLKGLIKRLIFGFEFETYFFSQSGEDAILKGIFNEKLKKNEKGFYLDIGAYHPIKHSNTLLFYREGWSGINIEPNPYMKKEFQKYRKRDINLDLAIGLNDEMADYVFYGENSTLNTFDKTRKIDNLEYKEISVRCIPLKDVFLKYKAKSICVDFMTIDVEGFELNVLKSNDWNIYRPKIVLIEQNSLTISETLENQTTKYLLNKGYEIIAKTIIRPYTSTIFFKDMSIVL